MATVYKIEIEVTSHWVSYTAEQVKAAIEEGMKSVAKAEKCNNPRNEIDIANLKVRIIA